MATDVAELSIYLEESKISSIIAVQAIVRGYLVRKWFHELRDQYMKIVRDIQRGADVDIIWKGKICKPQVVKASRRKTKQVKEKVTSDTSIKSENVYMLQQAHLSEERLQQGSLSGSLDSRNKDSPRINTDAINSLSQVKTVNSVDVQTETEDMNEIHDVMETVEDDCMFNSVETQTSMIDTRHANQDVEVNNQYKNTSNLQGSAGDGLKHIENDAKLDLTENKLIRITKTDSVEPLMISSEMHLNLDSERSEVGSETDQKHLETGIFLHASVKTVGNEFKLDSNEVSQRVKEHGDIQVPVYLEKAYQQSDRSEIQELKETAISERSGQSISCSRSSEPGNKQGLDEIREAMFSENVQKRSSYKPDSEEENQDLTKDSGNGNRIPDNVKARREISPLPRGRHVDKQRFTSQETSTFTNVTSVWDSTNSIRDSFTSEPLHVPETLPTDPDQLHSLRKNIALELLWVQQAINSRKNYLRLKQQM